MTDSIIPKYALSISDLDGHLVVDSRLIALNLGIQHETVIKNIRKYVGKFQAMGHLRFNIGTVTNSVGATNQVIFVYLNELQSSFLMTLSKNTDTVVECKFNLSVAFDKAKSIIKTVIPAPTPHQLPSRELAVETAIAIDKIQDILSKSNPRLAQILIDCAMNDIVEFARPAIASEFPEDRWYGLVQIASKMGVKTDSSTRVKLGQYVGKRVKELNLERVQEERLCNGQYEAIWCYRDNDIIRSVILDWNQQV